MRSLVRRSVLAQLGRFACVGMSNTALSYAVYAALLAVGAPYVAAAAVAFSAGALNGYMLNRRWTFRAGDTAGRRLRYLAVQVASLGATTNLLWLLVSVGGIHRLAAYLVVLPLVTVASYAANRSWAFAAPNGRFEGDHKGSSQPGPLGDVLRARGRYLR